MKALPVAAAFLALALAPALTGAESAPASSDAVPRMPDDVLALAEKWAVEDADALAARGNVSWAPKVQAHLDRADAYREAGRFRSAFDSHLSARVALAFYELRDEVDALESESQKRARVIAYGDVEAARARDAFDAFRADLHALDGALVSLRAHEAAVYAGTFAMESAHATTSYDAYRREIASPGSAVEDGLVLGVVDTTRGARVMLALAHDLVGVAEARDGVRPAVNATAFESFTRTLRAIPEDEDPQPHVATFVRIMANASRSGEDFLAIAAWSASVRAEGIVSEQFKFQDAAGRGLGATKDLRENVNRTLEEPLLEAWTDRGFDGLVARDALDSTRAIVDGSRHDVATYVRAWIDLVHANFTARSFGGWSPIQPPAPDADVSGDAMPPSRIPAAGGALALGVVALAGVALGAGRRDRR